MSDRIGILGFIDKSIAILIRDNWPPLFSRGPGIDWRDPLSLSGPVPGQLVDDLASLLERTPKRLVDGVDAVVIAVSGIDGRFPPDLFVDKLRENVFFNKIEPQLASLSEATHEGAFHGQEGVLVRCGHGSSVFARCRDRTVIAGGWGAITSDSGSAVSIGLHALAQIQAAHDLVATRPQSRLARELLTELRVKDATVVTERLYERQKVGLAEWKKELYRLGWIVVKIASADCENAAAARAIIDRDLRALVSEVVGALRFLKTVKRPPAVCLAGSLFEQSKWYKETFETRLGRRISPLKIIRAEHGPLMGIALLALRATKAIGEAQLQAFTLDHGNSKWASPACEVRVPTPHRARRPNG
jgi:N-acetylglucosamine kinase-like BadF-type ATPase